MTVQDILTAHVAEMSKINKAGMDRAILVGEVQAKIVSDMVGLMQDPVGSMIDSLKPEVIPDETAPPQRPV
jgi:UDP-glucose 4-epimerase